jgi:hypothetical protein
MPGSPFTLIDWLREFWRGLEPGSDFAEPSVRILDEWRTEFHWRGLPLTFDRRRKLVLCGGRVLARYADIKSVDVEHRCRDDERPEYWKVSLSTGMFSGVQIGTTRNDVEASIAAARIATIAEVKVRSL